PRLRPRLPSRAQRLKGGQMLPRLPPGNQQVSAPALLILNPVLPDRRKGQRRHPHHGPAHYLKEEPFPFSPLQTCRQKLRGTGKSSLPVWLIRLLMVTGLSQRRGPLSKVWSSIPTLAVA